MPVPRRKVSRARKKQRRSQHRVHLNTLVKCPQCREMTRPHRVCPHCGYYKGQEVVRLEPKS